MDNTTQTARHFETEVCSRCGGTGTYSYCQSYGHTCFKCAGMKVTYTKRGAAASIYMQNLLSMPAGQLKPGMKVRALVITDGGQLAGERWSKIVEIKPTTAQRYVNDERVTGTGVDIVSTHCTFLDVAADSMYRVAADAPTKLAAFEKALAYQDTLTKQGTARKARKEAK